MKSNLCQILLQAIFAATTQIGEHWSYERRAHHDDTAWTRTRVSITTKEVPSDGAQLPHSDGIVQPSLFESCATLRQRTVAHVERPIVVAAPCVGTPSSVLRSLEARLPDGADVRSGLLLDYGFLPILDGEQFTYKTWLPQAPVRRQIADGRVEYLPMRASDVETYLEHMAPQIGLIRVSAPNKAGLVNLGGSASYGQALIASSRHVVAEVDESLPQVMGDSWVPLEAFDEIVETETRTPEHHAADPREVESVIADRVLGLLPDNSILQFGIGAIPEAICGKLAHSSLRGLRLLGMVTDALVPILDSGVLAPYASGQPPVLAVELMGTRVLLEACHANPLIEMRSPRTAFHPAILQHHDRFISINSALQIDLSGQAASEGIGSRIMSGIGGSIDFSEGARLSRGGRQIIALPSKTRHGHSSIVANFEPGTPVTIPRHCIETVVTEHGVADLRGCGPAERARRLIAIADPGDQASLAQATPTN